MVNSFQSIFQVSYDKTGIGFKGPKSNTLEENFSSHDIHDQTFDVNNIDLYFALSSLASSNFSIPCDFFDLPSPLSMVVFVNMVSLQEIDPFYHPLDDDSFIVISLDSMNFSISSSSISSPCHIYLPPHLYLGEEVSYYLVSSIYDLNANDHSYLPILKHFEPRFHMHVGGLVEIHISDDPKHPKIVYLDDILTESKWDISKYILVECQKIFTFNYKYMSRLDLNLIVHNIVTYLYAKPIKNKP